MSPSWRLSHAAVGLSQDVRAASVRALTAATLLALHRDDFKRMLGNLQVTPTICMLNLPESLVPCLSTGHQSSAKIQRQSKPTSKP